MALQSRKWLEWIRFSQLTRRCRGTSSFAIEDYESLLVVQKAHANTSVDRGKCDKNTTQITTKARHKTLQYNYSIATM